MLAPASSFAHALSGFRISPDRRDPEGHDPFLYTAPHRAPSVDKRRMLRGARAYRAGVAAEEAALRSYQRQGVALLCRRRRSREGEIDLILRDGNCIVFVEVKGRTAPIQEDPVTASQWQRLEAAAERYMLEAGTGDMPLRFDLALVDGLGAVEVIKNARM